MADLKDWMATAEPDAEWNQAVKDLMGGVQPNLGLFPSIDAMRTWLSESKQAAAAVLGGGEIEGVEETDHQVSMRDGHKITCRVYRPASPPAGGSPLAVFYHGGGFCIGDLDSEQLLCRKVVEQLGVVAVNVDYRLAPEWKFPYPVEDSWDATKWAVANASSLGADPSKGFVIGGTSAGGNITVVVSLLARDEKLNPPVTGTLLMVPFYVDKDHVPEEWKKEYRSWDQNQNAPILPRQATDLFMDNYLPEAEKRGDPMLSPGLWKDGTKGLPPAVFQICGQDPLRDEALIVEREMRDKHGIKTKLHMYPGLPHAFWSVIPTLESSKRFVQDSVDGVKWLLEQT